MSSQPDQNFDTLMSGSDEGVSSQYAEFLDPCEGFHLNAFFDPDFVSDELGPDETNLPNDVPGSINGHASVVDLLDSSSNDIVTPNFNAIGWQTVDQVGRSDLLGMADIDNATGYVTFHDPVLPEFIDPTNLCLPSTLSEQSHDSWYTDPTLHAFDPSLLQDASMDAALSIDSSSCGPFDLETRSRPIEPPFIMHDTNPDIFSSQASPSNLLDLCPVPCTDLGNTASKHSEPANSTRNKLTTSSGSSSLPTKQAEQQAKQSKPSKKKGNKRKPSQELLAVPRRFNIPQHALHCFQSGSAAPNKRSRSMTEKRNRAKLQKAGGACYLCRLTHRQCSGRPCETCKTFLKGYVDATTDLWGLCFNWPDLDGYSIFGMQSDRTLSLDDCYKDLQKFEENPNFGDLTFIVGLFTEIDKGPGAWGKTVYFMTEGPLCLGLFASFRLIFQWRQQIEYFAPRFSSCVVFCNRFSRLFAIEIFKLLSKEGESWRRRSIETLALIYESLEMYELENSLRQGVQQNLKCRLTWLCRKFILKHGNQSDEASRLSAFFQKTPGLRGCVPHECIPAQSLKNQLSIHEILKTAPLSTQEPCLLGQRKYESTNLGDMSTTTECFCGTIFHTMPSKLRKIFQITRRMISNHFHREDRSPDAHFEALDSLSFLGSLDRVFRHTEDDQEKHMVAELVSTGVEFNIVLISGLLQARRLGKAIPVEEFVKAYSCNLQGDEDHKALPDEKFRYLVQKLHENVEILCPMTPFLRESLIDTLLSYTAWQVQEFKCSRPPGWYHEDSICAEFLECLCDERAKKRLYYDILEVLFTRLYALYLHVSQTISNEAKGIRRYYDQFKD